MPTSVTVLDGGLAKEFGMQIKVITWIYYIEIIDKIFTSNL